MAQTGALLHPPVDFAVPSHVVAARIKMNIRETESVEKWLGQVSSTALRQLNLADVEKEQEKLFAERFALIVMVKEQKDMIKAVRPCSRC